MSKRRGRWSAREVEIRDGIKHCETERGNKTEQNSGRRTESRKKKRDENQETIISSSLR